MTENFSGVLVFTGAANLAVKMAGIASPMLYQLSVRAPDSETIGRQWFRIPVKAT
jgi:hypothetical protein